MFSKRILGEEIYEKRWLKVITIACVTALSVATFLGCDSKGKEDAAEEKDKELNTTVFEGGLEKHIGKRQ